LSESLKQSKQTFFSQTPPRFHHPYFWANFIVIGPDEEQKDSRLLFWTLGIASILALLGWLGLRMRNPRSS
ncbi:MAG: hypothetical protein AAFR59_11560, partial [Bacteroidota bacterium]